MTSQRDPASSLHGCERILVLGRTGSGKTTLARQLAATIGVAHVELDSLYFGADLSTVPLPVLRERTSAAIAGDRWVTDGNKSSVRDLVMARDTVVWLDYPVAVSLWRLGKRAVRRTSTLTAQAAEAGTKAESPGSCSVLRRACSRPSGRTPASVASTPGMFAAPQNRHLAVVRLRSPRATRRWLGRVVVEDTGRRSPPG